PASRLDGQTLKPFLRDEAVQERRPVISEYTGEGSCAPCRMIRKGDFKLIYTHGFPDLLYDLHNDPLEMNNLANSIDYTATVHSLGCKILRDWNPVVIKQQVLQSQRKRRLIQPTTGGDPNWAFKARPDDDRRYVRNSGAVQTKAKARYPFVAAPPIRR